MEDSYVYITMDKKNHNVMYVGSGKDNRMNHVLSVGRVVSRPIEPS